MNTRRIRALLADDEPLLAADLADLLALHWPGLEILPLAADGPSALAALENHQPELAFLDIRMPGMTGLEVARSVADAPWRPHIVFVTAYDQYAIDAFEHAAADYLLKPVRPERLERCIARLRERLQDKADTPDLAALFAALKTPAPPRLRWIRAATGDTVRMIPVEDVIYFSATDKYVLVLTRDGESLIRTPLKELIAQLDPEVFQQVHRGTVVNLKQVLKAGPDGRGHLTLTLANRSETLTVSRSYTHLFRQM